MTVSDETIIGAIEKNPEQGFRLFMWEYKEPVYWHIRRLVVSHADAQDASQNAFVRVFRSYQQFNRGNRNRFDHSKRILAIREKYYEKYSKFLSQKEIEQVYELERQAMRRMSQRNPNVQRRR